MKRRLRIFVAAASAASLIALSAALHLRRASEIDPARFARPLDSTTVLSRDRSPLRHVRIADQDRIWVPLSKVSRHAVDATLAIEDARFREHHGVDQLALLRAALSLVLPGRRLSGASTISQQVVKLVYGRDRGWTAKPLEIARALRLEQTFDKDEILEQYLNRLPYGNGIIGIERASRTYFGHDSESLTLSEAALLAGIPQAPSITEPIRHSQRAQQRRGLVLSRLRTLGWRGEDELRSARSDTPRIVRAAPRPYRAARFVDRVLEVRRIEGEAPETHNGQLVTSLDLALQTRAESILRAQVEALTSRGATNGAAVVLANETGEVLAYVGAARNGPTFPGGELDLLEARRQPGSTLKPFVYEAFFERGGTAATVLDDSQRSWTGASGVLYTPVDFDRGERGPVRAREALAASLNLAALDVAGRVGQDRLARDFERLGLGHVPADEVGAAVVLGGWDVRPIDLARAYSILARRGSRIPLRWTPGPTLEPGVQVIDAAASELVVDILSDPDSRAAGFGSSLQAEGRGFRFGLKTGTSSGFRDAWCVIFDRDFTVLVWIGDPDGRPMDEVSGWAGASLPALRIFVAAHHRAAPTELAASSLQSTEICAHSGLLPGPRCTHRIIEHFVPGTAPHATCEAHDDAGRNLISSRFSEWLARHPQAPLAVEESSRTSREPTIVQPRDHARLLVSARSPVGIPLRATVAGAPSSARWRVDGQYLPDTTWNPTRGEHELLAEHQGIASRPVRVFVEIAEP